MVQNCGKSKEVKHSNNPKKPTKIVGLIADVPLYVFNQTIDEDLNISVIKNVIRKRRTKHHNRLERHRNALLQHLLGTCNSRRPKRN
nr:unnamed protein product [Callosobruchus chinensis]